MTTQRGGLGQSSGAADEQAGVFCSCEFNEHCLYPISTGLFLYCCSTVGGGGEPPLPENLIPTS